MASRGCCPVSERSAKQTKRLVLNLCCPVTQRLGKQLSRKIFCLVGIFKELEQALLVCHADRIEWNRKQNVQFVHNLVNTIL